MGLSLSLPERNLVECLVSADGAPWEHQIMPVHNAAARAVNMCVQWGNDGEMMTNHGILWYSEAQSPKDRSNACRQGSHLQGYMGREVCWRTATPCHTHHTDLSHSRRSRFHLDHPWQSRCCVVPIEKGHAKPTKPSAALASFVLEWRLPRNSFPSGKNADSVGGSQCSDPDNEALRIAVCHVWFWLGKAGHLCGTGNVRCNADSPSQVRLGNLLEACNQIWDLARKHLTLWYK